MTDLLLLTVKKIYIIESERKDRLIYEKIKEEKMDRSYRKISREESYEEGRAYY